MKIYTVLVYQTYSERVSVQLHVKAISRADAHYKVSNYMKEENKKKGFEYYSEYTTEIIHELKTIN